MKEADLISIYPRLFHMAEDGSWPSIQANGLLSTSALLDRYGVIGEARHAIEFRRRPGSVIIARKGLPDVTIRDQKPMSDQALLKCLQDDLTPQQSYQSLNQKVFFWLSSERLWRLLRAKAHRVQAQTVLTLDTASLVASHRERILLSSINSGSTIMNPQPRGTSTFVPIKDYPFAERRRTRSIANALVELTVTDAVTDVLDHVIAVHRVENEHMTELWHRPGLVRAGTPIQEW